MFQRLHAFGFVRMKYFVLLLALIVGSYYIIASPGVLEADASQYHEMALGLTSGQGFILEGEVSMEREPLYPLFRAGLLMLGIDVSGILWVQLAFLIFALWVFMLVLERFSHAQALWSGAIAAVYPGFMIWPSLHLSESLSIFLLAIFCYLYDRALSHDAALRQSWWKFCMLGIVCGLLILTKAAYLLLPIVIVIAICFQSKVAKLAKASLFFVLVLAVLMPWLYRNHVRFDRWSITNRSGWMVYARGIKTEFSWGQLLQTGASVLVGESVLVWLDPEARPIVRQQWVEPLQSVIAMRKEGVSYVEIDRVFMERGKEKLFSHPANLLRYAAWIPIETVRLLAFVSPRSPLFNVEQMFIVEARAEALSWFKIVLLAVLHFFQFVWIVSIFTGLVILLRRGLFFQINIVLVLYTIGIYVLFDSIARYSAPVFPLLVSLACVGFGWHVSGLKTFSRFLSKLAFLKPAR
ncbi:glycosyltransferase family 39 protein [Candidatus Uhrbacteria bacterium]|jgi:4-amino-4-deoxy-L-arabinose transferase-like glycosyltransferase|nr:MAG: glycosyltransferase family 39 protein [Candidatus Uhrbacteria bacterium]